jgi:hypothetical protein
MQRLESLGNTGKQVSARDHHRRVVCPVPGQVGVDVAAGDGVLEEVSRTPADMRAYLNLSERWQAVGGAGEVYAGSDGGVAVGEGTVKVEEHGTGGGGWCRRHHALRVSAAGS